MAGLVRCEGWIVGAEVFDEFDAIAAVTPTEGTGTTAAANALTWDEGDLLITLCGASHGNTTPLGVTPAPISWAGAGSETWTKRADGRAIISTSAVSLHGYTATALSAETAKAVTTGFNSAIFQSVRGFLRCQRSTIVRQATPVAVVEGTGTSISAVFADDILETSQIVSFVVQRSTTAFVQPADFTLLFAQNSSTNHRSVAAARIGHTSNTVTTTGLTSASAAKAAFAIELARPGQEL